VTSVGELVEAVDAIESARRQVLWYRGHADSRWDVEPSIARGYSTADERNLTNRFRSRAPIRYAGAPPYDAAAAWLSLMQGYGLPTRLLDWTRSPVIAAYFAIEPYLANPSMTSASDATVWVLAPHSLNSAQGISPPVTPSIDAHICERLLEPAFSDSTAEPNTVMAVMASETDLRMSVQQGCFTIHSDRTPLNKMSGRSAFLWQIVIEAPHVLTMAHQIRLCGLRQGDLFPDLGNLAQELKRTYPPG
jgi:FRG domain-containing protein